MRPETTLFYDVDTQRDFLLPGGKLYVAGAERIIPALAALTLMARRLGIKIVASTDRHFASDPELERNGGAYPDHCMDGTAGQRKIDATAPLDPVFVPPRQLASAELAAVLAHPGEIIIEKPLFDAFAGNRNTRTILCQLLRVRRDVVIYGVYTEVCVNDAVRGLLPIGCRPHVVTDAIADIGADGTRFRERWAAEGVELLTLRELSARFAAETANA